MANLEDIKQHLEKISEALDQNTEETENVNSSVDKLKKSKKPKVDGAVTKSLGKIGSFFEPGKLTKLMGLGVNSPLFMMMGDKITDMNKSIVQSIKDSKPEEDFHKEQRDEKKLALQEQQNESIKQIELHTEGMVDSLKNLAKELGKKGLMGLGIAAGILAAPIAIILGFVDGIKDSIKLLAIGFKKLAKFLKIDIFAGKVLANIKSFVNSIRTIVKESRIFRATAKIVDSIKKPFKTFTNFFGRIFEKIKSMFTFLNKGFSKVNKITTKFPAIVKTVDPFIEMFRKVFNFLKGFGRLLGRLFLPLSILMSAFDFIKGFVSGYSEKGIIGGIKGAFVGLFDGIVGGITRLLRDGITWVLDFFGMNILSDKVGEYFNNFLGSITKGIEGLVDFFVGIFTFDTEKIMGGIKALVDSTVSNFKNTFIKPIMGIFTWIKDKVTEKFTEIKDKLLGLLPDFSQIKLPNMMGKFTEIKDKVTEKTTEIKDKLLGLLPDFSQIKLPNMTEKFTEIKDKIVGWVDSLNPANWLSKSDSEKRLSSMKDSGIFDEGALGWGDKEIDIKKIKAGLKSGKITKGDIKLLGQQDDLSDKSKRELKKLAEIKRMEIESKVSAPIASQEPKMQPSHTSAIFDNKSVHNYPDLETENNESSARRQAN